MGFSCDLDDIARLQKTHQTEVYFLMCG